MTVLGSLSSSAPQDQDGKNDFDLLFLFFEAWLKTELLPVICDCLWSSASSKGLSASAVLLITLLVPVVIFCHVVGPEVRAERDMPGIDGAEEGQSFGNFQPLVGASLTLAEVRERPFFANGLRFGMPQPPSSAAAKAGTSSSIAQDKATITCEVFTMANSLLHREHGNRTSDPKRPRAPQPSGWFFRVATCRKSFALKQERLRGALSGFSRL